MTPKHPAEPTCRHRRYQLTCAEFGALLERANGNCEICQQPFLHTKPYIDHDHALGIWAVRGLLCASCNVRLGTRPGFAEEPKVAAYLSSAFKTKGPVRAPVVPQVPTDLDVLGERHKEIIAELAAIKPPLHDAIRAERSSGATLEDVRQRSGYKTIQQIRMIAS